MYPGVAAVDVGRLHRYGCHVPHRLGEVCHCAIYVWSLDLPKRGPLGDKEQKCAGSSPKQTLFYRAGLDKTLDIVMNQ